MTSRIRAHHTKTGLTTFPASTSATAALISLNGYVAIKSSYGVTRVSISTASLDAIVRRGQRDVLLSGFVALVAGSGPWRELSPPDPDDEADTNDLSRFGRYIGLSALPGDCQLK